MTTLPRVCHIDDGIEGAVYVGRANPRKGLKASKWGNPFRIGDPLQVPQGARVVVIKMKRHEAVRAYRDNLFRNRDLLAQLPRLRNAPALACWCRHDGEERTPENECHADVLVELLQKYTDEELREMSR